MKETLKLLAEKIAEERMVMLESLGMGVKDFAQYSHSVGVVLGLMKVQGIIAEMMRNSHEDGDDE